MPKLATGSDRRLEILKSAAAAFRRRGYHGASVDEIASALEMTKGNLYYYFKNKEEILFACHDYSLDVLLALMTDVQADASRPDDKLRKLILAFIHMMLDELQGTALTLDLQALSPVALKRIIAKRDRFDHGMRQIIQQGMDDGLFRPGDPKMIGFAIMGAVNWITKWFDPAGPMSSADIGQRFAEYLIGGLLRDPSSYSAVSPGFNSNT
ncbi:MAG TPA: TetR/AcrR family transcriptional regulator [Vicinamibacterales bacterium]|nr:TetR/AcrR family transcriptional regulator [Vicinamibacterales bacterium]